MNGKMEDNMIEVRGAFKRHDENTVVLRDLNMTVQRGSIYAFLGPSGCGKTTLLKCIVGRMRLDAGEIILGVRKRSQIGYMPQDTALIAEITIKETLSYYGWMYGLRGSELETRKEVLYGFLDIPPENKQIKKLSGGQQRRVSLCIALLNNPDLMILDEPTVGTDPLLSYSIWQCLLKMSIIDKKTILMTTHYIEEAKQANRVGMMRGGCLLVEGEAATIAEEYNCTTLDQVFVKLSAQQENSSHYSIHSEDEESYPLPKVRPKLPLVQEKFFTLKNFISLLLKNLYFLKYSPLGWFLILFVPISASILFEYSIGGDKFHLKLGVVNEELGQKMCDGYNFSCNMASCEYITFLQERKLELILYEDLENAYRDARKNVIWGYLHFSQNFTDSLYERIVEKGPATDEILRDSEISAWIDMSNTIMGEYLKKSIYAAFTEFLKQFSFNCNLPIDFYGPPIQINPPIYGSKIASYKEFPMLLMLEFFLPMTYASALLEDKLKGIMERSFVAGHTPTELVAAQVFVTLILFLITTSLLTTIFYGIFNHPFEGSIMLALALLILVGIAGIFYGISVALMFNNHASATSFVLGSFLPLTLLSGLIWPVEGMHRILRSIGWLLPLTRPTEAYRSIAIRSWTIDHPTVYEGFLSSLLWIIITLCITIILLKTKPGIAIK